MPSTHLSLHYHIIFSTKGRRRMIADTWRDNLNAYIGGIIGDMNAVPTAIGGPGDHTHVLVGLRATHVLADVVRQMKRGSSEWIHSHGVKAFAWQEGYSIHGHSLTGRKGHAIYRKSGGASPTQKFRGRVSRAVAI